MKKDFFTIALIVFFSANLCVKSYASPNLEEVIGKLEKQHSSIKRLAAQFRQEKLFSFMDKPVVSHGFIIFESPNKIRFDITEPFRTTILNNGNIIKRYEFIDNQWKAVSFGGSKSVKLVMNQIGQWMQGKFAGQEDIFELSASTGDSNDYAVLELKPRDKQFRQYIEKIQIHIGPEPLYRVNYIKIQESQGDSFSLIFSNEQPNRDLPKDCFTEPQTVAQCLELFDSNSTAPCSDGEQKAVGSPAN
jgi:outer membrane lipoprotein-sorting protein